MTKKIMFLNPTLSLTELYNDLGESGSELPPLGISILAAITRQNKYDTSILDSIALRLNKQETVRRILDANPDYLGITSTTMAIFNAVDIATEIKKQNKGMKIILGGPHLTAAPLETMERFDCFDVGVFGEAENTILELLDHLDRKKSLDNVKGLVLKKGKKVMMTEHRPYIKDLDELPLPAWDLLPNLVKYYQPAADSLYRSPATLLITSRGCPGQCIFCEKSVFGNLCRAHSAPYVIKMIKYLIDNYGIKDLFIEDDNFLVFKGRMKEVCKTIIDEKIDITWSCMGRVDMVDEETLKLAKQAGCWQINYGCESGSQKILDILNKRVKVEQIEKAVRMTSDAGIGVKGLFMLGNFGETEETIKETMSLVKRIPLTDFHMTYFTPLPGSKAWELAPQYGTFDPDWKKANMFNMDNFVPNGLTKEQLEMHYKRIWRSFYFRPRIVWNYTKKMKDPALRKKIIKSGIAFTKFLLKNDKKQRK
jgi:anaerobic magnesium-protoporphyrin IX monomethyl ester cyclase